MSAAAVKSASADERLLLIRPALFGPDVTAELSARFRGVEVVTSPSLLSGVCEAGQRRFSRILACIEPADVRLDEAVRALRQAAGTEARLILCCPPEAEVLARSVLASGADDYVVHPFADAELESALGPPFPSVWRHGRLVSVGMDEVRALDAAGELLSASRTSLTNFARAGAELIRQSIDATDVRITLGRTSVILGSVDPAPVMECPVSEGSRLLGMIAVGPKARGAYSSVEMRKLDACVRLIALQYQARRRERRLLNLSSHDDLTGLLNRRAFGRRLDRLLDRARHDRLPLTIVIFDVDGLKTCNDAHGHDAGDVVLRTVADLLRRHCRKQDLLARLGGDEFAMVMFDAAGSRVPGSRHPVRAIDVLTRFRDALRVTRIEMPGGETARPITISAGLASWPWDGDSRDILLRRADLALLEAKRGGRDRIVLMTDGRSAPTDHPS